MKVLLLVFVGFLLTGCGSPRLNWPFIRLVRTVPDVAKLRDPSWSSDGKYIAVASEETSTQVFGHIYVVQVESGQYTSLSNQFWNLEPHWAPDSSSLAYSQGCTNINIVDKTDRRIGPLIKGCGAVWSPDGTQLAVYSQAPNSSKSSIIGLFDIESGKLVQGFFASDSSTSQFGGMAWSGATNRIAISLEAKDHSPSILANRDILVVEPNTNIFFNVAATSADEFDPSWSPDGKWLVFLSASEESDKVTLVFAKADGSCLIPTLSSDKLTGVDWSPSGETLAVTYRNQLYVVDIAKTIGNKYTDLDSLCETNP